MATFAKPLTRGDFTAEEEEAIYAAVFRNMRGDDLLPEEVIRGSFYQGDRLRYLFDMARIHGVPVGSGSLVQDHGVR